MSTIPQVSSNTPSSAETTSPDRMTASGVTGQDTFLRLLVSQIKNQDPLNPMDSMNFVTQLAQFSQLEATLNIRDDMRTLAQQVTEV